MAQHTVDISVNQGNEPILALGAVWSNEFGNALEAMADERPTLEVRPGAAQTDGDIVWWKQTLDASPGSAIWIGTAREACMALGQSILKAAGVESTDHAEIRDTYLEVVRQSLGTFATAIGAQIGQEVTCVSGREEEPPRDKTIGCEIALSRSGGALQPLFFVLNREMLEVTGRFSRADSPLEEDASSAGPGGSHQDLSARASSTLDLLMDVELPVSVSFGRTRVRVQEILKLITGSIIELDRSIAEPVEVIVNNCVVARGEVVVVDGNYGVRINEVMTKKERLQESRRSLLSVGRSGAGVSGRNSRQND